MSSDALVLFALNATWQIAALALLALGLGLVFGLLRIMNMAHGDFVMLGAYAPVLTAQWGLPPLAAIPVCLLMVGLTALIVERLVIRHLYARMFDSLLATWALSILMREGAELAFGPQFRNVPLPFEGVTQIGTVGYPSYRLLVIGLVAAGFLALWLWYRRSLTGLKLRAMVDNPTLAEGAGINTARLSAGAFVAGCLLAGLAGLLLAPTLSVYPGMGLDALIRSFFTLIVGGLGTLEGLAVGAAVIGGLQAGLSAYLSQTAGYLGVLILAILFLWRRPDGLYRHR
ncbi:branched-chain amino acid ABC transporter permease [Pararhodobacter aggregans]|uniref:Branched-chain amino acid ABC transporter permease n=1 Tax=Pararhodobacter aggregans TaxID=404875 RepID=A0A2T7USE9_9RHOB|nr:branched-chain amino acid ABC transporter permease [Pararhodobacter aggregans]PTX03279.1 amino acid/amide ABC transporter membrane protein 1 (HAAT family) [Pararhodobacter aggregans]PVE47584.1 branched-chain amino acid ABC transporter permease [Pararhodobacter aggregans]